MVNGIYDIAFNADLLKFLVENFGLQKVADVYELKDVSQVQNFMITLFLKGLLPTSAENIITNGEYVLVQKNHGYSSFRCSYYDSIEWNDFGIYSVPEHGSRKEIISNAELIALASYIDPNKFKCPCTPSSSQPLCKPEVSQQ